MDHTSVVVLGVVGAGLRELLTLGSDEHVVDALLFVDLVAFVRVRRDVAADLDPLPELEHGRGGLAPELLGPGASLGDHELLDVRLACGPVFHRLLGGHPQDSDVDAELLDRRNELRDACFAVLRGDALGDLGFELGK